MTPVKPRKPAWLARLDAQLGLMGKISLALATSALLTLVVAATAWLSFHQVVAAQRGIIDHAVPAMEAVQAMAQLNTRALALVEQLGRAESTAEVARLERSGKEQLAGLRSLLQGLERHEFEPRLLASLAASVDAIEANLARQADEVGRWLTLRQTEQALLAERQGAVAALVMLADSLAANASTATNATISSLYPLLDRPDSRRQVLESLDRLIEVDIDRVERMAELQMVCFNLKTRLERLEREQQSEAVGPLRQSFAADLELLHRRLQDIRDPGRKAEGMALHAVLAGSLEDDGLFALHARRLALRNSLTRLRDEGSALARQLNEQGSALVSASSQTIEQAGAGSRQAIDRGVFGFFGVAALLFLALMGTLWFIFRYDVLDRLKGMEGAVRELVNGNYAVAISHSSGRNDPLAPLVQALEQFRDNARERQRLEETLLRHQQELEKLVAARTAELQRSNLLLEREVAEHAEARRAAEEANRAKNEFLGTLSHELRTPLSGVSGSVELLRDSALDAQQQEYVRMIAYANTTLLEILEDILGFSRLEAGKLVMDQEPFAVRDVIDDMLALQSISARAKGIALVRDIAPDVPERVVGDRRKLNQILLNTIGNAIKFTDEGEVTVSVSCLPAAAQEHLRLCFEVADTGIGIPASQREAVFKPFVQVTEATHRRPGGTGLGLAICQRLVELMGGRIGLDSVVGEGTRVRFELPFDHAAGELPERAHGNGLQPSASPLAVLVVEDDEINRIVCQRYLEFLGHRVLAVGDGEAALELLRGCHERIDVVLMDISLPGASGPEVTRDLRCIDDGRWAAVPVVAMSAHVSDGAFAEQPEVRTAGFAAFLSKPFDRATLARVLAEVTAARVRPEAHQPSAASTPAAMAPAQVPRMRPTASDDAADGGVEVPLLDDAYLAGEIEGLGCAMLRELLMLFRKDAEAAFAEFRQALDSGDSEAIARRAHRLRSAAGNLGFARVIAESRQLEQAAVDSGSEVTTLTALIDTLQQHCDLSGAALEVALAGAESTALTLPATPG
ncbi:MAG: TMAO reductase system sensor histidine kinase/response regulator TorS [Thauera sp.]|nr:TMAO reductase system sensor histidine kinase/response regulator TorS [Thauera sp.]